MSDDTDLFSVKLNRLRAEKLVYVNEKKDAEQELSELTALIRRSGRLQPREYNAACGKQSLAKDIIRRAEKKIASISLKISELSDADHDEHRKAKVAAGSPSEVILIGLVSLQDKYMRFSEDSTRVNSMRLMAGAFAKELTALIRQGKTP